MKAILSSLILSTSLVALAAASAAQKEKSYLTLGKVKPVAASPGNTVEAALPISVNSGFHIQANPASGPNLIATTLEVTSVPGIEVGQPIYPEGKPYKLAGSPLEIAALEGAFEIKIPVTVKADAKPGKRTLKGTLRYQACDDKICFFPTKVPITVTVEVTPKAS